MATTRSAADQATPGSSSRRKRVDAVRNEQALLDAAAAVFVRAGVDAPVRDIAAEASVGVGTIYRHFPTRADLVVAVFRHQLDALSDARMQGDPFGALRAWVHEFADFLVTKHGLAGALRSDRAGFESLHGEFLERLLPVCERLLTACADAGRLRRTLRPVDFLHGVGNLCIGVEVDHDYDVHALIDLLLDGLHVDRPVPPRGTRPGAAGR